MLKKMREKQYVELVWGMKCVQLYQQIFSHTVAVTTKPLYTGLWLEDDYKLKISKMYNCRMQRRWQ